MGVSSNRSHNFGGQKLAPFFNTVTMGIVKWDGWMHL